MKIIKIKKVKTPERFGKNAGIDFFIPSEYKETIIKPQNQVCIPSGIKVKLPNGYCMIALNKSGISIKYGLQVGACLVDENYTGEIHINLFNISNSPVTIKPNQKILQFVILKANYVNIELFEKEEDIFVKLDYVERGSGKFGSTGK